MANNNEILERLRFELKFLEDGGYGRSPRTPWRSSLIFEDSPSCLNFNDSKGTHPCNRCFLMEFVPKESRGECIPCRFIPITGKGETINHFYEYGTQVHLEAALKGWLKKEILRLEEEQQSRTQETNENSAAL